MQKKRLDGGLGRQLRGARAGGAWAVFLMLVGGLLLAVWLAASVASVIAAVPSKALNLVLAFVFFFPLGAYFSRRGYRLSRLEVGLYEDGFTFRSHDGFAVIRWTDVVGVREKVDEPKGRVVEHGDGPYRLELRSGREIVIDEALPDHKVIGGQISARLQAALLPLCEETLARGERVTFGSWALDRENLYVDGQAHPWSGIESVRWEKLLTDGSWAVHEPGKTLATARVAADHLPNAEVFMALVDGLGKLGAPKESALAKAAGVAAAIGTIAGG